MSVRPTFWVVCTILAVGFTGSRLTSTPAGFLRVVYLSVLLIAFSWIWAFFSTKGLSVRRTSRVTRQQVGQIFEERYEITNRFFFMRLWLEVRDRSQLPGEGGSRVLSWIGARQQRSYSSYTWLTQRGEFLLGPTELISGDPFGLFANRITFKGERILLVLPYLVGLKSFPAPTGILPGGRALRRRTTEVTPFAAGVRDYVPGDSLNRIHWLTTARRNRMMVKEFDQDPQGDVWIFVDAQHSEQLGNAKTTSNQRIDQFWLWRNRLEVTLPPHTFEHAISAAASIANYFIQRGKAVGMSSAGHNFTVLTAERGERQLAKILEILAFLKCEGNLPLLGMVESQASQLTRGSTVILITPSADSRVQLAVSALIQRKMNPVAVLIDRYSFGDPNGSGHLMESLRGMSIPAALVQNGANLAVALEIGFV